MSVYEWVLLLLGVSLQLLILRAMLHGAWRRCLFLLLYIFVSFCVTVTQTSFHHYFGYRSREYAQAYWIGDFVGTFVLLALIIHLIRRAMQGHPYRDHVSWGLVLGVAVTAVASALWVGDYSRGFRAGGWLTELGRNYYFGAVLLNAILWITLIRVQHADRQVYLISSGLGLKLTGAAIAHALLLTTSYWSVANHILVFTYFASLYVWYIAVTRFPAAAAAGRTDTAPSPVGVSVKNR
jgi:hypothetical protein